MIIPVELACKLFFPFLAESVHFIVDMSPAWHTWHTVIFCISQFAKRITDIFILVHKLNLPEVQGIDRCLITDNQTSGIIFDTF